MDIFLRIKSVANSRTSLSTSLNNGSSSVLGNIKFLSSRVFKLSGIFVFSLIRSSLRLSNSWFMIGFFLSEKLPSFLLPFQCFFAKFDHAVKEKLHNSETIYRPNFPSSLLFVLMFLHCLFLLSLSVHEYICSWITFKTPWTDSASNIRFVFFNNDLSLDDDSLLNDFSRVKVGSEFHPCNRERCFSVRRNIVLRWFCSQGGEHSTKSAHQQFKVLLFSIA